MKALTANQKRELKLTRLGGDGMWVSNAFPVRRTYLALRARGLVEIGLSRFEGGTEFVITEAGRQLADRLIGNQRPLTQAPSPENGVRG